MSKRIATRVLATTAALAMLAVSWGVGTASPTSSSAAKLRVVKIVMADPGCHWFSVAGKNKARMVVQGTTAFKNLDEAAVVFKGKNFVHKVAVGKTLTVTNPGTYRIKMVGQHPDDNTLLLVVK